MNYKIEGAIRRNKKFFILFGILWIFIAIVFVSPLSYSWHIAGNSGKFDLTILITTFGESMTHPFSTFGKLLADTFQLYLYLLYFLLYFSLLVLQDLHQKMNFQILNMVQVIGAKEENNIKF